MNHLGFNGNGADWVAERFKRLELPDVPVGVNIGKMNDSDEGAALDDYRYVFETLYEHPDYFVVNVSCPNTPEKFDEQSSDHLWEVFSILVAVNEEDKPILVKVGPDSNPEGLSSLVDIVHEFDISGIIATNTTTDYSKLSSDVTGKRGGVSGKPLTEKATQTVRTLARFTDLPIVGVGGVRNAETAYQKIRSGASLVQLYTGFVYNGPATARQINSGLLELLERDGFDSVDEAVGVDIK